eukprot:g32874.t1
MTQHVKLASRFPSSPRASAVAAYGGATVATHGGCWDSAAVDDSNFIGVNTVFGYGSIIWRPPFPSHMITRQYPALVKGFTRRFWQSSTDHRGTPTSPGLVATLLRDSHPDLASEVPTGTYGMCYTVHDLSVHLKDLDFREKNGYTRTVVETFAPDGSGRALGRAVCYYADSNNNPAYKKLHPLEAARTIRTATGPSGPNIEYFVNLHSWLVLQNVKDPHVEELMTLIRTVPFEHRRGTARL